MPKINNRPKGFLTIAQNGDVDYVRLAYALALSLRHSQISTPFLTVAVTPGTKISKKYRNVFDNVIEIPWGDDAKNSSWKLENEWKSIWISPYEETIKLDADMLFFTDIEHWWDMLHAQQHDIVWANTVLDWKGSKITDDLYRKVFTKNQLPNIYTGFGYFRKTPFAFEFFNLVKMIFWNWELFFENCFDANHRPTYPSTDVIFALAMKLIDVDQYSYKESTIPTFTHMKSQLQGWSGNISEDWRLHLTSFINNNAECKLGTHKQLYPLHYHIKEFMTDDIIKTYERILSL